MYRALLILPLVLQSLIPIGGLRFCLAPCGNGAGSTGGSCCAISTPSSCCCCAEAEVACACGEEREPEQVVLVEIAAGDLGVPAGRSPRRAPVSAATAPRRTPQSTPPHGAFSHLSLTEILAFSCTWRT